jgi:hypothetical protein
MPALRVPEARQMLGAPSLRLFSVATAENPESQRALFNFYFASPAPIRPTINHHLRRKAPVSRNKPGSRCSVSISSELNSLAS